MAIMQHWIDDRLWVVNTVLGTHTCSGFHLSLSFSLVRPLHLHRSSHSVKKITHQGRASLSTALLNSDPQSSSWPWLASLGEPWSGFHKPPPNTHTHTQNYTIVARVEALIKSAWVVKWAKRRRTFLENDLLFKWGPFSPLLPTSLPLSISLSLFVLLQCCLYHLCNCVINCRGLFSDIIRFCGASLSPESKTSNKCFTPNLSFIKDDSVAVLFVCESSICVLCPLSNFLTQDKKTFPLPSVSHLSVPLAISLPSFFLGLLTIHCQLSCLFCPTKNVSSSKPAPRMDFAIHCRKALWLLFRKKKFPQESVFFLQRLHVCVPKPAVE